jgi:hypothetical protein
MKFHVALPEGKFGVFILVRWFPLFNLRSGWVKKSSGRFSKPEWVCTVTSCGELTRACLKMEDTHNLWPFSEVKHSDQWIWITLFLDNRTCVTVKQRYGLCTFVLPSL